MEMRDSILSDRPNALSAECQEQVTFELLGEFGDIKLNPKLAEACSYEVHNLCMNSKGSAVMECLKEQEANLGHQCHSALFKQAEIQAELPIVDTHLMKMCKSEIRANCKEESKMDVSFAVISIVEQNFGCRSDWYTVVAR